MYRLTPRQAVVIVTRHPNDPRLASLARDVGRDRLADLLLASLRDAVAAVVRVDGVSLSVVAPNSAAVVHLRQLLPAGLDIVTPPSVVPDERLSRFALASHLSQDFERVVVLDGAVLRLTARVVGTGLGALANADVVVGGHRRGSGYAFGLLTRHIAAVLSAGVTALEDHRPPGDIQEQLRGLRLRSRRLDPLPTLDAFPTLDDLRHTMMGLPGLGRHLSTELAAATWAPMPMEQPRHIG